MRGARSRLAPKLGADWRPGQGSNKKGNGATRDFARRDGY
jgi:hypothetical protein